MTDSKFQLSCESTVDLPYDHVMVRGISVLFYSYTVEGREYPDDMGRDAHALERFYRFIDEGKLPTTSQINTYTYCEYFRSLLKNGDVLHIAFGSGMTASVNNALKAAEMMKNEFPERKMIVVDSLCSCVGYGILTEYAADLRDNGVDICSVEKWLIANRKHVHHQFFTTDLKLLKRSGRVSGPIAAIATVLGICPLMRLDNSGHIISYSKVHGKRAALNATLDAVIDHVQGGTDYTGRMCVAHSNCFDDAKRMADMLSECFTKLKEPVRILDIGTIIASHCGAGTVAVFFFGDERE